MKRSQIHFATFLLAAMAIVPACSRAPEQTTENTPASQDGEIYTAPDPRGIQTVVAARKPFPDILQIPARVEPDPTRVIRVFAPVSGRIVAINVQPSQHVSQGEEIAELDSADVSAARANYDSAKAQADLKQKALDRAALLLQHNAIAQRDYEQAQADQTAAQAVLKQSEDQLQILGVNPASAGTSSHVYLRAPRSGVVLDVLAAPGQFSKSLDASDPICTIADISSVWVLGDFLESDVGVIRTGSPAEIALSAYPGKTWKGNISAVSDELDPSTHTLKARVVLPNPGLDLKPEMYGTISAVRSDEPALTVPTDAVVREGNSAYVFVQKGENRFQRRDVTLGRTTADQVEIKSGLQPGETIVSEGAILLRAAS